MVASTSAEDHRVVSVRVETPDDLIATVQVTVTELDPEGPFRGGQEVRSEGAVIGCIYPVGGVFVALAGPRRDRSVECTQTMIWDHAVAALIFAASADMGRT